jgi:hypothetical protein
MEEKLHNENLSGAGSSVSRRAFLLMLARGLVAGSLLAVIGVLMTKHGAETCQSNGICRDCTELADCGLPQALSVKQTLATRMR